MTPEQLNDELKEKYKGRGYIFKTDKWNGLKMGNIEAYCSRHDYHWNPRVKRLLSGSACKKCGYEKPNKGKFFEQARIKFGNLFNYDEINYKGLASPLTIKCLKHNHSFTITEARHHLESEWGACPLCNTENRSGINHPLSISKDEFIERCKLIHGENTYSYDLTNFTSLRSIIKISCSSHNRTWESSGSNHVSAKRGCILCGYESIGNILRKSLDVFIEQVRNIHGNDYTFQDFTYVNNSTDSFVTCKKHGNFPISPSLLLKGYGCPSCSSGGISKGQIEWLDHLVKITGQDIIYKGGKYNTEKTLPFGGKNGFRVDGFCQKEKRVYEFLGCWYHGCPECFPVDKVHCWSGKTMKILFEEFQMRKEILEENGFQVTFIWECEWKKEKNRLNLK